MSKPIKVAIAEDKTALRENLARNLGYFPEVEVVFTAKNGLDILEKVQGYTPDLVLMDIEMPGMNGIEATEKIKLLNDKIKILMLTVFDDDKRILQAIVAGANGYLLKEAHPSKIVDAILDSMAGGAPLSPWIASKTLRILQQNMGGKSAPKDDFGITEREMQVLTRMAEGQNYQQVSEDLFVSPKTVRNHIQNIYQKLHVNSKIEAINTARDMGWL